MSSKSILATCLAAAVPAALAQIVDNPNCGCYVTDGSKPTYFSKHGFWDFRSLSSYAGVPDLIETRQGNVDAPFSSSFFEWGSEFDEFWGIQNWDQDANEDSPLAKANSFNNVYIEKNTGGQSDTFMTMRTARLQGFQATAEMESREYHSFASMRYHARTVGASGACTAMFTYKEAPEYRDVQEADIEFLTKEDPRVVHYTNQPSVDDDGEEIDESTRIVTLPSGQGWDQWMTHRQDWTPGKTLWYVNGEQTAELAFQTPKDASRFMLNAWSDGGVWTGFMPVGEAAYQQVQWIEILFDQTEQCSNVCSIDVDGAEPGKAVPV